MDRYWRSIDPDWSNGYPAKTVPAPCGISSDVFLSQDFDQVGLLSVHRLNKATQDRTSVAAFEYYNGNLVLLARDGKGKDSRVSLSPRLKPGQWYTLAIEFLPDGRIVPLVNGERSYKLGNSLSVPVDPQHDAGFVDGHGGIISAVTTPTDSFNDGDFVLNDNFLIYTK